MCSILDTRLFLFPFKSKDIEKKHCNTIENTILQFVYFAGKSLKSLKIHCSMPMKFLREVMNRSFRPL